MSEIDYERKMWARAHKDTPLTAKDIAERDAMDVYAQRIWDDLQRFKQRVFTEVSESDASTSYPINKIIWSGKTAYCENVVFAESPTYGRMLFLDGELQSAAADERIYHESLVHPVLVATDARRVLVVGGGEGATVREVLRWPGIDVTWVDIDTELVDLCKEHLMWAAHVYDNPRVRFIGKDIATALPDLGQFDAIILDLPDPDGDTGFLYSTEFWSLLKTHLTERGRIVTHVGPVRPFGNIGEGLHRVWNGAQSAGIDPWIDGFYSIIIPSFQGSWGFWISEPCPLGVERSVIRLPHSLHVVDAEQLVQWALPPLVWRKVLGAQVQTSHAVGHCQQYA